MIRYALCCKAGHGFEGWFRGLEDFETQKASGLLACPVCGSGDVDKAHQAAAVRRLLGGIGPRRGVQQHQPRHPFGGPAHHLHRDVAAHRQAGECEPGRGLRQQPRGDGRDRLVSPVIGDLYLDPVAGQLADLRREQRFGAEQAGNENEGIHRLCPCVGRSLGLRRGVRPAARRASCS